VTLNTRYPDEDLAHAAALIAVTAGENVQIQPARKRIENLVDILQHEGVLRDVAANHSQRHAGGRRGLRDEVVGRLLTVADRKRTRLE